MAFATQHLINKEFLDLNPLAYGWASCAPGECNPPFQRQFVLLHYVRKGCGILHTKDKDLPVNAGQAFLIRFGEICTYSADSLDPWEICWVGFDGNLSNDFAVLPSVFHVPEDLLQSLRSPRTESDSLAYELASDLFMLHARLVPKKEKKRDYTQIVKDYIQNSFRDKISVEQIANELGLDKRYLVRVFKKHTGFTIQGYILSVRLQASKQYLQNGYSVQEASKLSGFSDVYNFSRIFTREEGENPRTFKKNVMQMKKEAEEVLK